MIRVMFALLIVGLIWAVGLSEMTGELGYEAAQSDDVTGFEAFFFANLNLWIGLALIIAIIAVGAVGFG